MGLKERTELLLGKEKLKHLENAHILIVGLGGVGSYAAEHLCRAGIGSITIIDGDKIQESNLNRQLPALKSTIGENKTKVLAERLQDINPEIKLNIINEYIEEDRIKEITDKKYDYILDAIDTLSPKIDLIYNCVNKGHRIVSSMGAGGKTRPESIKISDISESYNCKLARMLRKKLHKRGIYTGFKVVFSEEKTDMNSIISEENEKHKKTNVGTISYMPAVFGAFCASVIVNDLINQN